MSEISKSKIVPVIALILIVTGFFTVQYLQNNDDRINIAVQCDQFDPYVIQIAEDDINLYCEEMGITQRFGFIPIQDPIEGPSLTRKEKLDKVINSGYSFLIGSLYYDDPVDTVQAFNEHNLFMINPDYQTSRLEYPSDRIYAVMADIPEASVLTEVILHQEIETIITVTSESLRDLENVQEVQELFEAQGGSVYENIILPYTSSLSQNVEENYDFTETLLDINSAVKNAINETGEGKVGILLSSFQVPVLLYQSQEMDVIQQVPWFSYNYDGYSWSNPYAETAQIHFPVEVMVDKEKVAEIEHITNRDSKASLPSAVFSEIEDQIIGAQHSTLYDSCWLMALSVLEANSVDASEVSAVFRDVAAGYNGVYGNYTLNEEGDRCNFKVGISQIIQEDTNYVTSICYMYDVYTGELVSISEP